MRMGLFMYKLLNKHGQALASGLGVLVIAIFFISVIIGHNSAGYDMGTDLNAMGPEVKRSINFFDPGLKITMGLVVVGALAWAIFGIYNLISSPKDSMKFIIGFGVVLVLFIIYYNTSESETTGRVYFLIQREGISETISKLISGGLKITLTLAVLAAAFMVVSAIRNFFK